MGFRHQRRGKNINSKAVPSFTFRETSLFYRGVKDVLIRSPLLDLSEGATYLKISNRALRDLCKRKAVRHTRLHHRAYRFRLEDLNAYLNRHTVKERGW